MANGKKQSPMDWDVDSSGLDPEAVKNGDDGSSTLRWTKAEDALLKKAVEKIGPRNWKQIASDYLCGTRTDIQCLHRWQKVLRPGLVKGPWTPEEDAAIVRCMEMGITKWSEIACHVKGRIGKQCRERWFNHLDPSIKRTEWTEEEDRKLIEGQALLGNKWSQIAKHFLPGRPENSVKNRWNAATRRRRSTNKRNKEDGSVIKRIIRPASEKSRRHNTLTKVQARFKALRPNEDIRAVGDAMDAMVSLALLSSTPITESKKQSCGNLGMTSSRKGMTIPRISTSLPTFPSGPTLQMTPTNAATATSTMVGHSLTPTNMKALASGAASGRAMRFDAHQQQQPQCKYEAQPRDMQETLAALQHLASGIGFHTKMSSAGMDTKSVATSATRKSQSASATELPAAKRAKTFTSAA